MTLHSDIAAVLAGESDGCIITGDCLEIMADMPDGCVDAVVTDPPYGCTDLEWDRYPTQAEVSEWLRISRGCTVAFGAAPPRCLMALLSLGPERVYVWWNTFTLTNSEGSFWQWQPIYVWRREFFRGLGRDVIQMPATVAGGKRVHPTQKPWPLMVDLIQACVPGDIILDPFCGSGTTCVAAKKLGRRWIGIEIDEKYAETARRRVASTPRPLFTEPPVRQPETTLFGGEQ